MIFIPAILGTAAVAILAISCIRLLDLLNSIDKKTDKIHMYTATWYRNHLEAIYGACIRQEEYETAQKIKNMMDDMDKEYGK
ncbi:MAG: hypothetical protein LBQ74_13880 [Prevotella sp.]|jgi:hypothetical protein|nr:hypothetical protein [Prevotella sp.]